MSRLRTAIGALTVAGTLAVGTVAVYESPGGKPNLNAYRDVVGIPTACFGETLGIKMGMKFTKAECEKMFVVRLDEFADAIEKCAPRIKELPDRSYVQFVSTAYNIGKSGFCGSTMAKRIKAGDFKGACDAILMWNKAGGRVIQGLVNRRKQEHRDCLAGLKDDPPTRVATIEKPPVPRPNPVPPVVEPVKPAPVPEPVVVDQPKEEPWFFYAVFGVLAVLVGTLVIRRVWK